MQYVLSLKLLLICFSGSTKDWNGLSITSRNGDDISDEKKSPFLNLKKKIRRTYTLHLKDFFDILTKKKEKIHQQEKIHSGLASSVFVPTT